MIESIAKLFAAAKSPFLGLLPPFLLAYPIGYGLVGRARVGKPTLTKSAKIIDFSGAISFAIDSLNSAAAKITLKLGIL